LPAYRDIYIKEIRHLYKILFSEEEKNKKLLKTKQFMNKDNMFNKLPSRQRRYDAWKELIEYYDKN